MYTSRGIFDGKVNHYTVHRFYLNLKYFITATDIEFIILKS